MPAASQQRFPYSTGKVEFIFYEKKLGLIFSILFTLTFDSVV